MLTATFLGYNFDVRALTVLRFISNHRLHPGVPSSLVLRRFVLDLLRFRLVQRSLVNHFLWISFARTIRRCLEVCCTLGLRKLSCSKHYSFHLNLLCLQLMLPSEPWKTVSVDSVSSIGTLSKNIQQEQKHLGMYIAYIREL